MFAGWYVVGGIISKGVTICVIITGKFKQSEIFANGPTFFVKNDFENLSVSRTLD